MTEPPKSNISQLKKKISSHPLWMASSHHQLFQDILTLNQVFKEGLIFLFEWCWMYLDMCPCWRFITGVRIILSNFKSLRNHKICLTSHVNSKPNIKIIQTAYLPLYKKAFILKAVETWTSPTTCTSAEAQAMLLHSWQLWSRDDTIKIHFTSHNCWQLYPKMSLNTLLYLNVPKYNFNKAMSALKARDFCQSTPTAVLVAMVEFNSPNFSCLKVMSYV